MLIRGEILHKCTAFDIEIGLAEIMKDYGFIDLIAIIRTYESIKDSERSIVEMVELIADFVRKLERTIFSKEDRI